MRLKPPLIQIPENDPFQNDLLGRKPCATALTNLIAGAGEGLVLCINASWGSGKSTFLSMWRQQLKNDGFKTLMFNAWESDYADDAMVALLGELELGVSELQTAQEGEDPLISPDLVKRLKKYGGTLVRRGLPVAIRLSTAGLLDLDDATIEKIIVDEAGKQTEERIKAYENAKTSIKDFRATLEELAAKIGGGAADDPKEPLVLIIDELDRCRPPFAVRILEIVKHFFAVPGIVFVLAMDREQLGHSIRSLYGEQMDVAGYLRRFFDVEFALPIGTIEQFTEALYDRFEFEKSEKAQPWVTVSGWRSTTSDSFNGLFRVLKCSARDQERCFSLLALAILTMKNRSVDLGLLAPLIVIKVKRPDLYKAYVDGEVKSEDIIKEISSSETGRSFLNTHAGVLSEIVLRAMDTQLTANDFANVISSEGAIETNEDRSYFKQQFTGAILQGMLTGIRGRLNEIDSKISLVEHFSTR